MSTASPLRPASSSYDDQHRPAMLPPQPYRLSLQPTEVDFDSIWFGQSPPSSITVAADSSGTCLHKSTSNIAPTGLHGVVLDMLNGRPVDRRTYNEQFAVIYRTLNAFGVDLRHRLYASVRQAILDHVASVSAELLAHQGSQLLEAYNKRWLVHREAAQKLNQLFGALNSQYVHKMHEHYSDLPATAIAAASNDSGDDPIMEIADLTLDLWRRGCLESDPLKVSLVSCILETVAKEREQFAGAQSIGDIVRLESEPATSATRALCRTVVQSFELCHSAPLLHAHLKVSLEPPARATLERRRQQFYERQIELAYVTQLDAHYRDKSLSFVSRQRCGDYVATVLRWLAEEDRRARGFLTVASSFDKVRELLQQRCIIDHLEAVLADSSSFIQEESRLDLKNLFELLNAIPPSKCQGLERLISEQQRFIESHANAAIAQVANLVAGRPVGSASESLAIQFVEKLLAEHTRFKELIADVYRGDSRFFTALDRAFCRVVNAKHFAASGSGAAKAPGLCIAPDLLARYLHTLLTTRKSFVTPSARSGAAAAASASSLGSSSASPTAVPGDSAGSSAGTPTEPASAREKLRDALTVFKYVDDKDFFIKVYSKFFAKRLIYNQSASSELEELLITSLKQACGYQYTSPLQAMFKDSQHVCTDLNRDFGASDVARNAKLPFAAKWLTLQSNAWPLSATTARCQMPEPLAPAYTAFEEFYRSHSKNRKLCWVDQYSHGEVRLNYTARPYIVALNLPQLAVLLLFNETLSADAASHSRYSIAEMETATQLRGNDLVNVVRALADCRLLLPVSAAVATAINTSASTSSASTAADVEMSDANTSASAASVAAAAYANAYASTAMFELNFAFAHKRTHFRVVLTAGPAPVAPSPSSASSRDQSLESSEQTQRAVEEDRKFCVQAAIVRIMKARKTLRHNQLVDELIASCRPNFQPSVALVKKCIEVLIEKQYLERAPNNADEYHYTA